LLYPLRVMGLRAMKTPLWRKNITDQNESVNQCR